MLLCVQHICIRRQISRQQQTCLHITSEVLSTSLFVVGVNHINGQNDTTLSVDRNTALILSSPPHLSRNYPTEQLKIHFCHLVSKRVGVFLLDYLGSEKLALRNHYLNDRLLVHRNSSTFNLSLPSMSTFQTLVVKKATITTCTVMLTGEVSSSNDLAFSQIWLGLCPCHGLST